MEEIPLPPAFVQRIRQTMGAQAALLEAALLSPPTHSIRINPFKVNLSTPPGPKVEWAVNGYYTTENNAFIADPLWHAGAYYVQEASGMVLETLLQQHAGHMSAPLILDLSASPGGKSTILSTYAQQHHGFLVANDPIRSRIAPLKENLMRWGLPNYMVTQKEAAFWGQYPDTFDIILVDAPCSGEGMFRKDPLSRKQWNPESPSFCAARQHQILHHILPCLKPGGILFYSTCTFSPLENQEQAALLERNGIELLHTDFPPEYHIQHEGKGLAFYPHFLMGEGFFIAAGRKSGNAPYAPLSNHEAVTKSQEPEKVNVRVTSPYYMVKEDNHFYLLNHHHQAHYQTLEHIFVPRHKGSKTKVPQRVFQPGLLMGQAKGDAFIPSPESAYLPTRLGVSSYIHTEVTGEQALAFLQKKDPGIAVAPGYHLLTYKGLGLGWIKAIAGRNNNLLPPAWRILKEFAERPPVLSDIF
jgi:16S rRNA C967 or C1407 C5-methylase (RsmB/RsmF family)